ncbi:MAG: glycosyltransferase, partial [Desulforhopalus sp.]
PIIVWNHRWEHDKNPEEFFQALHQLDERDIDFQLIVLGQSFNRCPDCFKKAQVQFKGRLVHFGFADTYQHYAELLGIGDIVISTAIHEFFGIAVIEAVRAGCVPLLPSRLSYPELFDSRFLYQEGSLSRSLETLIHNNKRLAQAEARVLTERYSWQKVAGDYEDWMFGEV